MITFQCACGQHLQVADELANRKVRCPKCRGVSVAPPATAPGYTLGPPPGEVVADAAPTIPSHHDLTIKPAETTPPVAPAPHLPAQRQEKEPNS